MLLSCSQLLQFVVKEVHEKTANVLAPFPERRDLDLQQVLDNVYDLRGFDLLLDYAEPPEVPLDPEETGWARGVLEAVLRPTG